MDKIIEKDQYRLWMFDHENKEFDEIRQRAVDEDGWLAENYSYDKFKVNDHVAVGVIYNKATDEPMGFAGIKEVNPKVVSLMHRTYTFNNTRAKVGDIRSSSNSLDFEVMKFGIETQLKFIETQTTYELPIIHMQQRSAKRAGQQAWWKMVVKVLQSQDERWTNYTEGLVQTYPGELSTCYQNLLYIQLNDYTIEDWNPKTMSYDIHALRMEHDQLSISN